MILNTLRYLTFRGLDLLTGGKIYLHYREIRNLLNLHVNKKLKNTNDKAIKKLLKHASDTSEFYKQYSGCHSLKDFPIINKNTVQENFDKFISSKFKNKKFHKVSTSGSTGVPFFLYQDINKRKRNIADVLYYFQQSGHRIGNRLYEFEVWRSHNIKGKFKSFVQNVNQFDVSKLTDERIKSLIDILNKDRQPKAFLGFASGYESICQYIEKESIKLPISSDVKGIVANSEYLNDYTRRSMSNYFDSPVYSRYSNEEIGIIAQQIKGSGKEFVINWASYFIELLDFETNEPVKPGGLGRIVVTDLYNYYMPLIRFDTGDVGVFTDCKDNTLPNFKNIEGRKMDIIYDTSGNVVSSFVVYTKFYDYYKYLKQYQFLQTGEKSYVVKLNLIDNKFKYENDLIESFKNDFGNDAVVEVEYVDEIPKLASGKRKKVVNMYTQE